MQQQLGPRSTWLENPIARDRAVTDKIAVEIVAHRGRKIAQLSALAATARPPQHLGVAVDLLEQQRDRPAAHHPVPHPGIDGLEGIVPIALAIANEMGAGDETLAHRGKQFFDMRGDRYRWCDGPLERVRAPPGDGLIEKSRNLPLPRCNR